MWSNKVKSISKARTLCQDIWLLLEFSNRLEYMIDTLPILKSVTRLLFRVAYIKVQKACTLAVKIHLCRFSAGNNSYNFLLSTG